MMACMAVNIWHVWSQGTVPCMQRNVHLQLRKVWNPMQRVSAFCFGSPFTSHFLSFSTFVFGSEFLEFLISQSLYAHHRWTNTSKTTNATPWPPSAPPSHAARPTPTASSSVPAPAKSANTRSAITASTRTASPKTLSATTTTMIPMMTSTLTPPSPPSQAASPPEPESTSPTASTIASAPTAPKSPPTPSRSLLVAVAALASSRSPSAPESTRVGRPVSSWGLIRWGRLRLGNSWGPLLVRKPSCGLVRKLGLGFGIWLRPMSLVGGLEAESGGEMKMRPLFSSPSTYRPPCVWSLILRIGWFGAGTRMGKLGLGKWIRLWRKTLSRRVCHGRRIGALFSAWLYHLMVWQPWYFYPPTINFFQKIWAPNGGLDLFAIAIMLNF